MKVERVREGGKIAFLYSPGYGAGWSTWNDASIRETLLFHPRLVKAAQEKEDREDRAVANSEAVDNAIVEKIVKELLPDEEYVCILGWRDVAVRWIGEGTAFRISDYDGYESLHTAEALTIIA